MYTVNDLKINEKYGSETNWRKITGFITDSVTWINQNGRTGLCWRYTFVDWANKQLKEKCICCDKKNTKDSIIYSNDDYGLLFDEDRWKLFKTKYGEEIIIDEIKFCPKCGRKLI